MLPHLESSLTSESILSGNGEMSAGLAPSVGAVLEPGGANEAVLQSRAPKQSVNCWVPLDHAYTHGQQGTDDPRFEVARKAEREKANESVYHRN